MTTKRVFSGAPWENQVGYGRAIRKGNLVFVSGTTSIDRSGQARAEAFGSSPPATGMYEVKALISPDMLIEIEVDAIVRN